MSLLRRSNHDRWYTACSWVRDPASRSALEASARPLDETETGGIGPEGETLLGSGGAHRQYVALRRGCGAGELHRTEPNRAELN